MKFIELQDAPLSYAGAANKNVIVNESETEVEFGGAYLKGGADADKGAGGRAGRIYLATDTGILYWDTGIDWVEIGRQEVKSRLASLAEKAHASLSGVSSDQHHAHEHHADHENGGDHEVSVEGLSGLLTDKQHVLAADVINLVYPVGSIYVAAISTNPGTLFGVGTWEIFGQGKVLIGWSPGEPEFDTLLETGGAKTVSVAHTHTGPSHAHTGPSHTHSLPVYWHPDAWSPGAPPYTLEGTTTGAEGTGATGAEGTGATGGMSANDPHSNLQPYIVVYMWKRTA